MENKKLKVMFDTNTYRHIIDETADENNTKDVYSFIANAIKNGKIEAFLPETIFGIEAIVKKERLSFFANTHPKITCKEKYEDNGINITFTISPDNHNTVNFDECEPLRNYYHKVIEMGFKILSIPRIGGIINREINRDSLYFPKEEYHQYMDKLSEVSTYIKDLGAGEYQLRELLKPYEGNASDFFQRFDYLFKDVNGMPDDEKRKAINKVAKVIAEFSDSEAVSASIGLDCDAFCTNDCAKSAGVTSVFSEENVKAISEKYKFNKVTPTELVTLI